MTKSDVGQGITPVVEVLQAKQSTIWKPIGRSQPGVNFTITDICIKIIIIEQTCFTTKVHYLNLN